MGPTASGKTEIAAKLYDQFDCELISVDAAQVFTGMDIGTAKPEADFLARYPHHLINIRSITESYSAAAFCQDARRLIDDISSRGKIPILVGGTMFYFSALENGLSDLPSADAELRKEIELEISSLGLAAVYQRLCQIDPDFAQRISSNDSQRIQRAMEIFTITQRPPSQVMSDYSVEKLETPVVKIALFSTHRSALHQRIESRFHKMLESGLVNEVKNLTVGLESAQSLSSMRSVGYRQVLEYLSEQIEYHQMIDKGIAATRQLAKRQLTWLRNQSNVVWFDSSHTGIQDSIVEFVEHHPCFFGEWV